MSHARKRSHRLEYMGAMAAGLAHEVRNPLSTISVNLQLLSEDCAGDDSPLAKRSAQRADLLLREVKRLEEIVNDFLKLARGFDLSFERVDLNDLLAELVRFVEPENARSGIHVRSSFCDEPTPVRADPKYLRLAVMNLLVNARQAMSDSGGDILLETHRADDAVEVVVTDTGPGIPADRLDRIFMPYFSTKKGGTGLGLPTARRIVEEHDGEIEVASEPGQGTQFRIRIPWADAGRLGGGGADDEAAT